jgi:peptide/nickel transport system ATP-binding protein
MTVGRALAEAIDPRASVRRIDRDRITRLLETVTLEGDAADRLPHEFSGGQRQRIVIARALAVQPRVVIADEVTSALDSSVQAEILDLLLDLQRRSGLALVFITHDLSIARYMCDEISVLYLGRMIEQGDIGLLGEPAHPYTELLRASVPDPSGRMFDDEPPAVVAADPGDPAHPPAGCAFHPRCPQGPRMIGERTICVDTLPTLVPAGRPEQVAACHFPLVRVDADD